ncbi:MAG: T9SS type A sorting domain-containing protein, partial [Bacteroidales bacterium]|nr:T9SS type A sorting domain-containing protein [Bacteroidales bacterium]
MHQTNKLFKIIVLLYLLHLLPLYGANKDSKGNDSIDIGISSIISPKTAFNLSYKEKLTVIIKNYGQHKADNFIVSFQLDKAKPVTDTIKTNFNPGDSIIYTFRNRVDLSIYNKTYIIKVYTSSSLDFIKQNDSLEVSITNKKLKYCSSSAINSDFEDIGKVIIGNFTNGKELPVYNNTSSNQRYSDFTSSLPAIRLFNDSSYKITIHKITNKAKLYSCFINAFIDYNQDGEFDFYSERIFGKLSQISETFVSASFTIPSDAKSGISRLRIVLKEEGDETTTLPCGSYNWGETEDYALLISPFINQDAGIADIIKPADKEGEDNNITVQAIIKNYGISEIKSMDVLYRLNSGLPVATGWKGSLKPNATATIDLPVIKIPAFNNNICVFTALEGDTNSFNDQYCKNFYGIPKTDIGIASLVTPTEELCFSEKQLIILRVKNYGSQALDFSINNLIIKTNISGTNSTSFSDTLKSGIINAGDSLDFTITDKYNMSAGGVYTFNAYTLLKEDALPNNNTMKTTNITVFKTINNLPHKEDFQSFITGKPGTFINGWKTFSDGYYRWQVNKSNTPTKETGPKIDHSFKSREGKYLHIEADSAGGPAYLISPCIDITAFDKCYLSFYYFMYGKDINSLSVDIYNGSWIEKIFTLKGEQQKSEDDYWQEALIDISQYKGIIKIRFTAERGNGAAGDIALDDISIFHPNSTDAGLYSFNKPVFDFAAANSLQSVDIKIRNYGSTNLKTLKLAYFIDNKDTITETFTTDINPLSFGAYQFTKQFSVKEGLHKLTVLAIAEGDTIKSNDTISILFYGVKTDIPYKEDFEKFSVKENNKLFNGWSADYPSVYKWFINKGPTYTKNTGPAFDHSTGTSDGLYIFTNSAYGYKGDNAALYSPYLDLKNFVKPSLSFWYHFYGDSIGSLSIDIYSNGVWKNDVFRIKGQTHNYQRAAWLKANINLSSYKNIIKIRFRALRGGAETSDMAIDDICINNTYAVDAALSSFNISNSVAFTAGSKQVIKASIENTGEQIIRNIYLCYIIGNNKPVIEALNTLIYSGKTYEYTFKNTFIIPSGKFKVKCFIEFMNDANKINDTLAAIFNGIPTLNLPYSDNFEGADYWESSDVVWHWQRGKADSSFIDSAAIYNNVWLTQLDGNYRSGTEYNLYSPWFDFSNIKDAILSFKHNCNVASPFDGCRVLYYDSKSASWTTLGYIGDPNATNWYLANLNGKHCFVQQKNQWISSTYKLTRFNNQAAPVRFCFNFFTTNNATKYANGWAIDDFKISLPPKTIDTGIESINAPVNYTASGSEVAVKVTIKNYGTATLKNIPLYYQVDTDSPVTQIYSDSLTAGNTALFTFSKTFKAKYAYNLCVYSQLTGDQFSSNDKKCIYIYRDAGIYWISQPLSQSLVDSNSKVTVAIKNYGIDTLKSISLTFKIDNIPQANEEWTGTLAPQAIKYYTFKKTLKQLNSAQTLNLCAYTLLQDDANPQNNQSCKSVNALLGINDIRYKEQTIYLSPNPCYDFVEINYSVPYNTNVNIELFSLLGVSLKSFNVNAIKGDNNYVLSLKTLPAGIYFITLSLDN